MTEADAVVVLGCRRPVASAAFSFGDEPLAAPEARVRPLGLPRFAELLPPEGERWLFVDLATLCGVDDIGGFNLDRFDLTVLAP